MKKLLILGISMILIASCTNTTERVNTEERLNQQLPPPVEYTFVYENKVIKDLKEVQESHTDYNYKYDWLNGKFRQQPRVYTKTQYFVIYKDGTHVEVDREKWLGYSRGDTIRVTVKKLKT